MINFDFVYLPEGETEFSNAHITLNIVRREEAEYCYEIFIATTDKISQTDVAKIVEELEQKRFKKMNINMTKDCKITVENPL